VLYAPIGEDFVQVYTQILRVGDEYYGKKQLQVRFSPLMTQIELDELELITDFEEFEVEIKDDPNRVEETLSKIDEKIEIQFEASDLDNKNFDPLKQIRELFSRPPEPRERKVPRMDEDRENVISKLSILKEIARDLKREDEIESIFDYLDDLDDLIEEFKNTEINTHAFNETLNQIRTLNIVRKKLEKKKKSDSINLDENIKVIKSQVEYIKKLQELIKIELDKDIKPR